MCGANRAFLLLVVQVAHRAPSALAHACSFRHCLLPRQLRVQRLSACGTGSKCGNGEGVFPNFGGALLVVGRGTYAHLTPFKLFVVRCPVTKGPRATTIMQGKRHCGKKLIRDKNSEEAGHEKGELSRRSDKKRATFTFETALCYLPPFLLTDRLLRRRSMGPRSSSSGLPSSSFSESCSSSESRLSLSELSADFSGSGGGCLLALAGFARAPSGLSMLPAVAEIRKSQRGHVRLTAGAMHNRRFAPRKKYIIDNNAALSRVSRVPVHDPDNTWREFVPHKPRELSTYTDQQMRQN